MFKIIFFIFSKDFNAQKYIFLGFCEKQKKSARKVSSM